MKRSRWPKILMWFLIGMLMLTLLSRAADSILLPVVRTARPMPGALKHTVMLSGTIEAREQVPVMAMSELTVAQVYVREGQRVVAGEQLMSYDLTALEAKLAVEERALKGQRAERERLAGNAEGEPDESDVRAAEQALQRAQEDQAAATEEQNRAVLLAEGALLNAQNKLGKAQAEAQQAFGAAYDAHVKSTKEAYIASDKALYQAKVALDWANNDMEDRAKKKYRELDAAVAKAEKRSDDGAVQALEKAKIKRDRIPGAREYVTKRMELEQIQSKHVVVMKAYEDAENRTADAVSEVEKQCAAKFEAVQSLQSALAEKQDALDAAKLSRDSALRARERSVEDADLALTEKQRALEALRLEVALKDEAIVEKQSAVNVLLNVLGDGATLRSAVDGTITEVVAKSGSVVSGTAFRLAPRSSGLLVTVDVSEDQVKYLSIGMEAKFQLSGDTELNPEVAVLKGLSPTGSGYRASFDLPDGAGAVGRAVMLTATQVTDTYKVCVPLSAIVESGGLKGVYRVRAGQNALGDMEFAEFVTVTITESDAQNAAIVSSLSEKDQVIVSSNKPIQANDRIRSGA